MPLLDWKEEWETGIDVVDTDHQLLISLINQFVDAINEDYGDLVITTILNSLVEYTKFHFAREEKLMEIAKFDQLEAHKRYHLTLTASVARVRDDYVACPDNSIGNDLGWILEDWLVKHILGEDRKYIEAVTSHPEAMAAAENYDWRTHMSV